MKKEKIILISMMFFIFLISINASYALDSNSPIGYFEGKNVTSTQDNNTCFEVTLKNNSNNKGLANYRVDFTVKPPIGNTFSFNNKTDENGVAKFHFIPEQYGTHEVSYYASDVWNNESKMGWASGKNKINVNKLVGKIILDNSNIVYGDSKNITFKVVDLNGNPLKNKSIIVSGADKQAKLTDENGMGWFIFEIKSVGTYNINVMITNVYPNQESLAQLSKKIDINVIPAKIKTEYNIVYSNGKTTITVKFTNSSGQSFKNQRISLYLYKNPNGQLIIYANGVQRSELNYNESVFNGYIDNEGIFKITIPFKIYKGTLEVYSGNYIFDKYYFNELIPSNIIVSQNKISNKNEYSITVNLKANNLYLNNKPVSIKYGGKTYRQTIKNNKATFKIPVRNLGKQTFVISFGGDGTYAPKTISHIYNFKANEVYKTKYSYKTIKKSTYKKYGHKYVKQTKIKNLYTFGGKIYKKKAGIVLKQISPRKFKQFDKGTWNVNNVYFKKKGNYKSYYNGNDEIKIVFYATSLITGRTIVWQIKYIYKPSNKIMSYYKSRY